LSEQDAEVVEDHLMLCGKCQNLADEIRKSIEAIQTALRERHARIAGTKVISIRGDKPPTGEDN
jgi:hypothetical protein